MSFVGWRVFSPALLNIMENINKIIKTPRGWVDLGNLVFIDDRVAWSKNIGKTIAFQYDNILSTMTIVETKADNDRNDYVYIDIPGYVKNHRIYSGQVKNGQLGSVINRITSEFKYNVDSVVNGLLITGKQKTEKHKYYSYVCTHDGYKGSIREDHLVNGHGCPVCTNKKVLVGYNDISTTRPDIATLFNVPEEAYRFTEYSNKYTYFKCPRCGNVRRAKINSVSRDGLSCKKCGDGISYPNKFVYNFMEQVCSLWRSKQDPLMFSLEKTFPWSKYYEHENKKLAGRKIYDIYVDKCNVIIENQGNYHYDGCFIGVKNARSLEEVQENDRIKKELAISNGIKDENYIVLDCFKSDMNYIKNSIMNSRLPIILNFTEHDIDWEKCDMFATSSRVYEACKLWNNGIRNINEIASKMKMNSNTISKYLCRGRKLKIINN